MAPTLSPDHARADRSGQKKNGNGTKHEAEVVKATPKNASDLARGDETLFAVRRTPEGRVKVVFDADEVQAARSDAADCATKPAPAHTAVSTHPEE